MIADQLGPEFIALFPPNNETPVGALNGFFDQFEDPKYFNLGCTVEAVAQTSDSVDLSTPMVAPGGTNLETNRPMVPRPCARRVRNIHRHRRWRTRP